MPPPPPPLLSRAATQTQASTADSGGARSRLVTAARVASTVSQPAARALHCSLCSSLHIYTTLKRTESVAVALLMASAWWMSLWCRLRTVNGCNTGWKRLTRLWCRLAYAVDYSVVQTGVRGGLECSAVSRIRRRSMWCRLMAYAVKCTVSV